MIDKEDMSLSEFMAHVAAVDNGDGSWSVLVPVRDHPTVTLTVDNCTSEYDAKERGFLYLKQRIEEAKSR